MLTPAQLAGARRIREGAMVDACTIRRPGGTPGTFDPVAGNTPVTPFAAYYSGPCRIKDALSATLMAVAEQQDTELGYVVEVPISETGPAVADLVTVTASQDPFLVGRTLTVTQVRGITYASSRVLVCTDSLQEA